MSAHFHRGQRVLSAGTPLAQARTAVILIHGRGASAEDIMSMAGELTGPDTAYLAPQANQNAWYPNRFFVPTTDNEPYLSSALQSVGDLVAHVQASGIASEKIVLVGFSQGACLALEYAVRSGQKWGGVAGLSGALIGPLDAPRLLDKPLDGTPVFLGCSDVDFHIPAEHVTHSAQVLKNLNAQVTLRFYRGMGHTINQDEIETVNEMLVVLA